jgi:hypothetical protein
LTDRGVDRQASRKIDGQTGQESEARRYRGAQRNSHREADTPKRKHTEPPTDTIIDNERLYACLEVSRDVSESQIKKVGPTVKVWRGTRPFCALVCALIAALTKF